MGIIFIIIAIAYYKNNKNNKNKRKKSMPNLNTHTKQEENEEDNLYLEPTPLKRTNATINNNAYLLDDHCEETHYSNTYDIAQEHKNENEEIYSLNTYDIALEHENKLDINFYDFAENNLENNEIEYHIVNNNMENKEYITINN